MVLLLLLSSWFAQFQVHLGVVVCSCYTPTNFFKPFREPYRKRIYLFIAAHFVLEIVYIASDVCKCTYIGVRLGL